MTRRLILFAVPLISALSLSGCIIIPIGGFSPELREVTVRPGGWWAPRVLMIDVDGVISASDGGMFGPGNMVAEIDEQLKMAESDHSIKAVLLRVNSPGGGVTASDLLYRRLAQFREDSDIPIYASMMDIGASGGYYVSMAADKVFVSPTTVTGSIGVIAVFPEGESLLNKIGVNFSVIKSGEYKDIGSLFRHMKPEERELMQTIVLSMYDRFVEVVGKGRPNLTPERIRELADGRVYTAQQAHASGLVDGVAYIDEVVDKIEEDLALRKTEVIAYRRWRIGATSLYAQSTPDSFSARPPWLDTLQGRSQTPAQVNLINLDTHSAAGAQSYFHYLWVP